MNQAVKKILTLLSIILLASFFRFYNVNWDDGHHLHPDERFLTMVNMAMQIPESWKDYINPITSTLNPYNVGYQFFVYGTFPTTLNKIIAVTLNLDNYNDLTIQGRVLSGLADLIVLFLVFIAAKLLSTIFKISNKYVYLSGFIYALMVLPIQLSHFFAVDTFLNMGMFMGFTGALMIYRNLSEQRYKPGYLMFGVVVSSLGLGLGLASKINALFMAPLVGCIVTLPLFFQVTKLSRKSELIKTISLLNVCVVLGISMIVLTYLVGRLANPYLFASSDWLSFQLNPQFISNFKQLKQWEGPDVWYPPAIQWQSKSNWFGLNNMVVLGLGIPISFLVLIGLGVIGWRLSRIRTHRLLPVVVGMWMLVFFIFQSTQFVKALRYFIFLYPFLALIAAAGLISILNLIEKWLKTRMANKNHAWAMLSQAIIVFVLMLWPLAFLSIYIHSNTRVIASEWIYENLPATTALVNEHWDDPLPLLLPNQSKQFRGEMLPVFGEDTAEKWQEMEDMLNKADYYFVTSNRGWASMMKVPNKYPIQSRYYEDLLSGNTEFIKIAEFTSYPSLKYLGIPFELNDDWLDETFTVYDHPKVMLFAKPHALPTEATTFSAGQKILQPIR